MTDSERIGKRIAEIRNKKGMSQDELADRSGLKQANISRIEAGKYSTRIDILSKIGDVFDMQIDFIAKT